MVFLFNRDEDITHTRCSNNNNNGCDKVATNISQDCATLVKNIASQPESTTDTHDCNNDDTVGSLNHPLLPSKVSTKPKQPGLLRSTSRQHDFKHSISTGQLTLRVLTAYF